MLDTQRIAFLIKKHLRDELTTEESLLFHKWLSEDTENVKLLSELEASEQVFTNLSIYNRIASRQQEDTQQTILVEKIKERIRNDENRPEPARNHSKQRLEWIKYAAAMVILFSSIYFYINQTSNIVSSSDTDHSVDLSDIAPGSNRAILKLPNGKTIDLDEDSDGIIAGNATVSYSDGRKIEITTTVAPPNAILTLEVPLRSHYNITLSDGTRVWVNAGSKLHYPLRFDENQRVVELEGEAYFEVSSLHGEVPFLVKSKHQILKVLGTKFNISAYSERADVITTLIEGKVSLDAKNTGAAPLILTPGQQSTFNGKSFLSKKVDVEQFVAWKNGQFYFDGVSAKDAFSQLAKWYDIDIIYEGKESKFEFFGVIDRDKNLNGVLDILQKSGLNFRLDAEGTHRALIIQDEQTN